MEKIDLVIPYVNGNDPNWIKQHDHFVGNKTNGENNAPNRFRSMDNLHYVFRGVEKYIPWINKIFLLVSEDSQVPWWVNRENIQVVTHKEFIPQEYLPTFNSSTIELFLHRIPNLSEQFIYTNDDLFFNAPIKIEECFKNGKSCINFDKGNREINNSTPNFIHILTNSWTGLENKLAKGHVSYSVPVHTIHPMHKSSFEAVWKKNGKFLKESISRVRENKNINQYIFSNYELKNKLTVNTKLTFKYGTMGKYVDAVNTIKNTSVQVVCINDAPDTKSVFDAKKNVNSALFQKFPNPSKYEISSQKSLVSIIIPCYNMEKYVTDAIDSVKKSTYKNWECILVDDGSTDKTAEVITNAIKDDERFKLIKQPNGGVGNARNNGIAKSLGKYILPLDPDDKIINTYIEKCVDCLDKNPDCTLVYGKYKDFGLTNHVQSNTFSGMKAMLGANTIHNSSMFRRTAFNKTNGYDEALKGYEDWEFWLRLLYTRDFVCVIDEVMLLYRVKSVSRNKEANKIKEQLRSYIKNKNAKIYSYYNKINVPQGSTNTKASSLPVLRKKTKTIKTTVKKIIKKPENINQLKYFLK